MPGEKDDSDQVSIDIPLVQRKEGDNLKSTMGECLSWRQIHFETLSGGKSLLDNVSGCVLQGEIMAIMGPSGCGKTTLLNTLAQRTQKGKITGSICVSGTPLTKSLAAQISTYVQQEDALIGALTVRETLNFAAKLSLNLTRADRKARVEELLGAFGLTAQADTLVGTPIQKGISGGQKRRLSVATQLITLPRIVFLDEPTSGLDSLAAYEIISLLAKVANEIQMIVVASIHSPSTATFNLFDKVLLLSKGCMVYHGPVALCGDYFQKAGSPIPQFYNPADHLLDVTNVDFSHDEKRLHELISFWSESTEARSLSVETVQSGTTSAQGYTPNVLYQTWVLLHRLYIKSYRDVVVYGVRLAMYIGLAIMMGTVWLRLDDGQDKIQPYINAMFFSSAFMSFMAVAYIPAFLEDRAVLCKDRANGLYGVTPFVLSNVLIGIPFLLIIALSFALITYWLINLHQTTEAFFRYFMFLYVDLLAAEALVVLIASLFPIFVAALAITAFANGMFMSTGGFLVSPNILNPFYKYFFYQIDYQRYTFEGLMKNEFGGRTYGCDAQCNCMYQTELASECRISGEGVLDYLGYGGVDMALWAGLVIVCAVAMRLMGWVILYLRTRA